MDTHEQIVVHMCGLDGVQRANYSGVEPIRRAEIGVRVRKLKNGKAAGNNKVAEDMIEG